MPVNDTLSRVHQSADLGSAILVDLRVLDAAFGDRHSAHLVRRHDAELDPADLPHGRLGVAGDDI